MDVTVLTSSRDVVTEINRNVAATLKLCGPALLSQKNMAEQTVAQVAQMVARSHPIQVSWHTDYDDDDRQGQGVSEREWLMVDTALDVVVGLAAALGPQFADVWKVFQKPVLALASSNEATERATAAGVMAEVAAHMGRAVTPFAAALLPALLRRLSDEHGEARSNAAYAVGLLVYHTAESDVCLASYDAILAKLEPMLQVRESRMQDNAAGCLCRMMLAHADRVPVADLLPVLVDALPLQEDYEENKPVYECIWKLCRLSHAVPGRGALSPPCPELTHHVRADSTGDPTARALTPRLLSVFEKVLAPPDDQLEPETRELVRRTVHACT